MRTIITLLASLWLLPSVALWPHRPATAVAAVTAGLLGTLLSVGCLAIPRLRDVLAALGAVLALSSLIVPDGLATAVNHLLVGMLLLIPSLLRPIRRGAESHRNALAI